MWKGTLIRGNDPDTKAPVIVAVDAETQTLRTNNWVWDPLASPNPTWIRDVGARVTVEGDLTVTMGDVERLLGDQYYARMKIYSHSSGNVKYVCKNTNIDAAESDTDWYCWKFTDADIPDKEGPRQSAVDAEATIDAESWNI